MAGGNMAPGAGCLLTLVVLALVGVVGIIYAAVQVIAWLREHVHVS